MKNFQPATCPNCKNAISSEAMACPQCGHPLKQKRRVWPWLALAALGVILAPLAWNFGVGFFHGFDQAFQHNGATNQISDTSPPPPQDKRPEIEVREDVFEGCKVDPTALGCPLQVVKITNRGEPIRIDRIVFNRRINNPDCDIKVGKPLKLGDTWSSESAETGKPMFAYSFTEHCGAELIYVDVATDHGSAEYSFKNGG